MSARSLASPRWRKSARALLATATLLAATAAPARGGDDRSPLSLEDLRFFEAEVRPILSRRCYECHSREADPPAAELVLDSQEGWQRGGASGPAIVPGDLSSRLLVAVGYEDPDLQMPPDGRIPQREIAVLREWIARGAPDPRVQQVPAETTRGFDLWARRDAHWAWKPVIRPAVPPVQEGSWPRDDLDRFIMRGWEEHGLAPAPALEDATWLRRVTFALRGMPPTPEEVRDFMADHTEEAYGRAVDRLLASKDFGERWAQHWLDLVRYAETHGHEQDFPIPLDIFSPQPLAFRYRDYVIRAYNADVPYDQFVMEHVAGDLLTRPRCDEETRTNQSIQGTAFWLLGEATHSPVDIRGEEADRMANQIDVFSKAFLGLTIGCARCHDHKFDAISAADYYALCGFLRSSSMQVVDVSDPALRREVVDGLDTLRQEYSAKVTRGLLESVAFRIARVNDYARAALVLLSDAEEPASPERISDMAREHALAPQRLVAWVNALQAALTDPAHPLHVLAVVGQTESAADQRAARQHLIAEWEFAQEQYLASLENRRVAVTQKRDELHRETLRRPWSPADVVLDYSRGAPGTFLASGDRFGEGPANVGEPVFSEDPRWPVHRFVDEPAARSDMLSERLPGFLRTPSFVISGDTLWYRFQGEADVFLAVDSHRVVSGPLHGIVRQKVRASGNSWQWFPHRVSDYLGHVAHVEFRPAAGFALSRIEFSDSAPPEPFSLDDRIAALARRPEAVDARSLADLFLESVNVLLSGELESERVAAARLANWWLEHEELLEEPSRADVERLAAIWGEYQSRRTQWESRCGDPVWSLALMDGSGLDEPIHIRGNHRTLSQEAVPRRFLEALDGAAPITTGPGSGRRALAERLVRRDNPFTARVYVNRLWQHLFGRGIVPTVDDFGAMGMAPTHPELLDYLAAEFMDDGWSTKRLIRRLVLSSTYRLSGRAQPESLQRDPNNNHWHCVPSRRLEAEAIRDSLLAVSGHLNPTMYGPSVPIHLTPFMRGNRSPSSSGPLDGEGRRSIYIEVRRNHLSHFLTAFDRPSPVTTIGQRNVSNTPSQPLMLLNDAFSHDLARQWALQLEARHGKDVASAVEEAFWTAFGRAPNEAEAAAAADFFHADPAPGEDVRARLAGFCHALFNAKELIFSP